MSCTRRVPVSTPSSSGPSEENPAQPSNATQSVSAPYSRCASATSAWTTASTSARMRSVPRSTVRSGPSCSRVRRSARRGSISIPGVTASSTGTCPAIRWTWSSAKAGFTGTRAMPSAATLPRPTPTRPSRRGARVTTSGRWCSSWPTRGPRRGRQRPGAALDRARQTPGGAPCAPAALHGRGRGLRSPEASARRLPGRLWSTTAGGAVTLLDRSDVDVARLRGWAVDLSPPDVRIGSGRRPS